MFRTYILPLLAVAGMLFAIHTVVTGSKPTPAAQPVAEPAQAPFQHYVAGAGLVEARSRNIAIGTPVAGLVAEVAVQVGQHVQEHDVLFRLDQRSLQAERLVRRASVQTAQVNLERLTRLPRREDVPPAEARTKEAAATLADVRMQLTLAERVTDKRAISQEDLSRRLFAVEAAAARLAQAQAELTRLKAGAWQADLDVAKAEVTSVQAQLKAIETDLERLTVRAPITGTILQVNIQPGEFATTGVLATPLILLGNLERLHIRIDIDENDAWRICPQTAGVAFVRGNRALQTALQFERIEPYVVPKRSLTGESTERVDTRVLQVLYSFPPQQLPVYVGQQMDVFLETPALGSRCEPPLQQRSQS